MLYLINEKGLSRYDAWNQSSVMLTGASKVYINLFVINCFLAAIYNHKSEPNRRALTELLELYLLYGITTTYSANILRVI